MMGGKIDIWDFVNNDQELFDHLSMARSDMRKVVGYECSTYADDFEYTMIFSNRT